MGTICTTSIRISILPLMQLFACRTEDELPKGAVVVSRSAVIEDALDADNGGEKLILYRVDEELLRLEQETRETIDACNLLAKSLG